MTDRGVRILQISLDVASKAYTRQHASVQRQLKLAHDTIEDTSRKMPGDLVHQYFRVIDTILNEIHTPLVGAKWDKR